MLTKHVEILDDNAEVLWMRTSLIPIWKAKQMIANTDGELTEKGREDLNGR